MNFEAVGSNLILYTTVLTCLATESGFGIAFTGFLHSYVTVPYLAI